MRVHETDSHKDGRGDKVCTAHQRGMLATCGVVRRWMTGLMVLCVSEFFVLQFRTGMTDYEYRVPVPGSTAATEFVLKIMYHRILHTSYCMYRYEYIRYLNGARIYVCLSFPTERPARAKTDERSTTMADGHLSALACSIFVGCWNTVIIITASLRLRTT